MVAEIADGGAVGAAVEVRAHEELVWFGYGALAESSSSGESEPEVEPQGIAAGDGGSGGGQSRGGEASSLRRGVVLRQPFQEACGFWTSQQP